MQVQLENLERISKELIVHSDQARDYFVKAFGRCEATEDSCCGTTSHKGRKSWSWRNYWKLSFFKKKRKEQI